jgi:hypothetical protein
MRKSGKWKLGLGKVMALVLAAVLLGVLGVGIFIDRLVTREWLVGQIGRNLHGQVSLQSLDVSLFRTSSRLKLVGLQFAQNPDDEQTGTGYVKIEEADLSVSLWNLLRRRLEITEVKIRSASILYTVYEDGGNSLEEIFVSPAKFRRKRELERRLRHLNKEERKALLAENRARKSGGFNIYDHADFVASLGFFSVEDSSVEILVEKSGLRIHGTGVRIGIGSLEIDPTRLAETDHVSLDISGRIRLESAEGRHYASIGLQSRASASLFDHRTGDMEPDVEATIRLSGDSYLDTRVPVVTRMWDKLADTKWIGYSVSPLPEKATFGRSQSVALRYHRAQITTLKPFSLQLADWEIAVLEGAWVRTSTNGHFIRGELLASRRASKWIAKTIAKILAHLPGVDRATAKTETERALLRDGRVALKVRSTGDLSRPKIRVADPVSPLVKSLRGKLLDKLQGIPDR